MYFEKKKHKYVFILFSKKIFLKFKILNENLLPVYTGSDTLKSAILASNSFWARRTVNLKISAHQAQAGEWTELAL